MISECFNPSCRKKLTYLRDGRVVRVIRDEAEGLRVEHFWLCGSCLLQYDFFFGNDKVPSIRTPDPRQAPQTPSGIAMD
jgi:hypothetical protein